MGHYYDCTYCDREVNAPCANMAQAKECDHFPKAKRSTAMSHKMPVANTHYLVEVWKPIATAPKNKWVLVRGESGYSGGCPVFVCIAKHDAGYRPRDPWGDVQNYRLSDHGWTPIEWTDVPTTWFTPIRTEEQRMVEVAQQLGTDTVELKRALAEAGFEIISK